MHLVVVFLQGHPSSLDDADGSGVSVATNLLTKQMIIEKSCSCMFTYIYIIYIYILYVYIPLTVCPQQFWQFSALGCWNWRTTSRNPKDPIHTPLKSNMELENHLFGKETQITSSKLPFCGFPAISSIFHQEFSGTKNGGTTTYQAILGVEFPYALHTAYIGEYLYFRYLKCLPHFVILQFEGQRPSTL